MSLKYSLKREENVLVLDHTQEKTPERLYEILYDITKNSFFKDSNTWHIKMVKAIGHT